MIDWLLTHPYTLAFLVIAIITRKDLAIYCLLASASGSIIWDTYQGQPMAYAMLAGVNALVVIFAGWYNVMHATLLSKAVMVLGTLGAIVNGWQLLGINNYNYTVSVILGVSLMASLLFMDGRKGLMNGLWEDMRGCILRHVHLFGPKDHGGSAH